MDDSEACYRAHAQAFQLPLLGLLLAVGVPANATLLLLFARHAELRTASNALILNIAVIDLLNLLLNVSLFLLDVVLVRAGTLSAPLAPCKPAGYLMGCFTGLSVFSVAALSVFRLRSVTSPGLGRASLVAALHVAVVWALGLACAAPVALSWGVTADGKCSYVSSIELVTYWNFAVFCAAPILVIAGTYTATAVRLARSARDMPGEPLGQGAHRRARRRSARVLVALTVVYALSNGPYFVNGVLVYLDVWADYGMQAWVALDLYCLSFANAMVNPLALCCTCANFRRRFRRFWVPGFLRSAPKSASTTANTASVFQISRHVT